MLKDWIIVCAALTYMGILFGVAYFGDKRADQGRSIIANPYIYTLSIAVYCTAWTFYGSAGRAVSSGIGFLPVYLGPTLVAVLFWFVLRRIVRITKVHRITSIADFAASRYGKSGLLAGLVTVIAVVGIMPYISIQLKAIATSLDVLLQYPAVVMPASSATEPVWSDTSFYVALVLIAFAILFGTRHIDNTERHEGLVAAVAFESLVKLLTFLLVGFYVTFVLFDGFGDVFGRAVQHPELAQLMRFEAIPGGGYLDWMALTFLCMTAFIFLPRQFQVLVVENVNESHILKATWLFPLYLLIINLFVLPIAFAGLLVFKNTNVDADTFVLALPMAEKQQALALLVFIGGLSAATSMIIVETVALSTMVCNDLVMPVLLRVKSFHLNKHSDLSGLLLTIRRSSIALMILLGYLYFRFIGESYALVAMGLVSFTAAAQFAPMILFGIYWKRANRLGALLGLGSGFLVWGYTLLLPAFARSGWLSSTFLDEGLFGIGLLRPYQLLGIEGMDPYTHAVFWSMLVNISGIVLGSVLGHQDAIEQVQASQFVDVFERDRHDGDSLLWRGVVEAQELRNLLARFIGPRQADKAFAEYAHNQGDHPLQADSRLIHYTERLLAGAIGSASARVMVSSVVMGEVLSIDEVMTILDESSQAIEYSRRLEQKSQELEAATTKLRRANERLQELDRLKDEFISTVTHELRTPLTSIRAFSEILLANPDMEVTQRSEFLGIVVKETERLTRLINDVLDLAKLDSGRVNWRVQQVDLLMLVRDAINATSQLFKERTIELVEQLGDSPLVVAGDYDRLTQVVINLLSNAAKFSPEKAGRVIIRLVADDEHVRIEVQDNGPGIPEDQQRLIFEKFHQVSDQRAGKPKGTGLGLAISERIMEHHGGRIWVESKPGQGAVFKVELSGAEAASAISPG
ncbi:MAG: histidine kinase [Gammaproteobacteria bacterium]|nr:histidine kinase [Gammaproteobacteria bacterium]MCP5423879.1 histidine kinase [Gammaproteobacteria bacterium]